jgi:hypothetical protein
LVGSSTIGVGGLRRIQLFVVVSVVAALAVAPAAHGALPGGYAPTVVEDPSPISTADRFGDNLVDAGDVTGDGTDDLLVGVPNAPDTALPGVSGKVVFIDGGGGGVLKTVLAPGEPSHSGVPTQFGMHVATLGDIGSCPGSCSSIGPLDGVPDHVVSAPGADISSGAVDMGIVYVLDGKSHLVMKRIELSVDERPSDAPRFGEGLTVARGEPACAGFGGIGACPDAPSSLVARGDLDGTGEPEIVIGAPNYSETADTNPAGCGAPDGTECPGLGRIYVFRGEDVDGSAIAPLDTPYYTIKYFDKATASQQPHLGAALAPVGDLGSCAVSEGFAARSSSCLAEVTDAEGNVVGAPSNVPDGYPDFLVGAPGLDTGGVGESGSAFVADGKIGLLIGRLDPPEPQPESGFASFNYGIAPGDLAAGPTADLILGAPGLDISNTDQGRAYVLNGDIKATPDQFRLATFDDPLLASGGRFGAAAVGIGNAAGDAPGEVAAGRGGGAGAVHIYSVCRASLLQTIPDPAAGPTDSFGSAIAPLGDLNGDGYLDLAIGAPDYAGGAGRVYLMKSNGTPGPAFAGCAPAAAGGGSIGSGASGGSSGTSPPVTRPRRGSGLVKRTLKLSAPRGAVKIARLLTLKGRLLASKRKSSCQARQKVALQRLEKVGWFTINVAVTKRNGRFAASTRPFPAKTFYYRARVSQTKRCRGALSKRVGVVAKP